MTLCHIVKTTSLLLSLSASLALADQAGRKHAENELHARPAVRITVGVRDADVIGLTISEVNPVSRQQTTLLNVEDTQT